MNDDLDVMAAALENGDTANYPHIVSDEDNVQYVTRLDSDGSARGDRYYASRIVDYPIPNSAGGSRSMSRVAVRTDCSTGTCFDVLYSEADRAAYADLTAKYPGWAPLPLFIGYDALIDPSKIRRDPQFGQLTPIGNIKPARDGFLDRAIMPLLLAGLSVVVPGFGVQALLKDAASTVTSFFAPVSEVATVVDLVSPASTLETVAEFNTLPLDTGADFVSTISETVPEVASVDEWAYDMVDGSTDSGWTADWADSWDQLPQDFTESPIAQDVPTLPTQGAQPTMPNPGAPVEVFRPGQSGMPGSGFDISLDKILSSGAGLIRQILNPSTSGTRTDPRTGRPIPAGAAIDPRTGLPVLDARGNFVRATAAGAGAISPVMLGIGALALYAVMKKRG